MKNLILIGACILIIHGVSIAQDTENKAKKNPCNSVVVQKAQIHGLRSLKWTEIPVYYKDMYLCKRSGQSLKKYSYIENAQIEADQQKTNYPKGWTSTFIYLTAIGIVTYTVQQSITNL